MSVTALHRKTFKQGSKTYYNSSVFFPDDVREEVFILYGFVRVADNYVDSVPQDVEGFVLFRNAYRRALGGKPSGDRIIDSFVDLMQRRNLEPEWVDAFLHSMELDLYKASYDSIDETLEYIYGSAEVIGLFMARLLGLPEESLASARMQGRAMQYINFIRDIDEDAAMDRRYLPIGASGLTALDRAAAHADRRRFEAFIREQIELYRAWQAEAEAGYRFIPRRYLIPIKTASDMYGWTADRIYRNPLLVFEKKVKPSKPRVILRMLRNTLTSLDRPGGVPVRPARSSRSPAPPLPHSLQSRRRQPAPTASGRR